jgi:hypothetical protein
VLALSLGSVACGPGPSRRAEAVQADDPLSTLLDSAYREVGAVPGAMLRVERAGGRFVWEEAVGVANPATGTDLRPEHTLRLASLTKTYVAAAVLRLAEDGAVALNDPIGEHLLPSTTRALRADGYDPSAITLRMLLRHDFIEGTIQSEVGLRSRDFWSDMIARIPLAVLFAWIYVNTGRSILSALMLHALDNVASVMVGPEGRQVWLRLVIITAWAAVVIVAWGPRTLAGPWAGDSRSEA